MQMHGDDFPLVVHVIVGATTYSSMDASKGWERSWAGIKIHQLHAHDINQLND